MFRNPKDVFVLVAGALMLGSTVLGGCSTGVDIAELQTMTSRQAWDKLQSKADQATMFGNTTGISAAKAYADMLEEQKVRAETAAANASTPREALDDMVADVSALLKTSLPADAKSKNLDQYRLNIAMGDLVNRNDDPALRGALSLIKRDLQRDQEFNDQFGFVALNQSDADAMIKDLATNGADLFDPSGESGGGQATDYNPSTLYVVTGETWMQEDKLARSLTVWTDISTTHVQSRRSSGGDTFSRTYYFHPGFSRFITEDENEAIRAAAEAAEATE